MLIPAISKFEKFPRFLEISKSIVSSYDIIIDIKTYDHENGRKSVVHREGIESREKRSIESGLRAEHELVRGKA